MRVARLNQLEIVPLRCILQIGELLDLIGVRLDIRFIGCAAGHTVDDCRDFRARDFAHRGKGAVRFVDDQMMTKLIFAASVLP